MEWTLLKITATVEVKGQTLIFDFDPKRFNLRSDNYILTTTMQDFVDVVGEEILKWVPLERD